MLSIKSVLYSVDEDNHNQNLFIKLFAWDSGVFSICSEGFQNMFFCCIHFEYHIFLYFLPEWWVISPKSPPWIRAWLEVNPNICMQI